MNLGTERHHRKYRDAIANVDLPGCFAMTELEHGSNVNSLGTQAVFDASTEEFVITTPSDGATKWWIGNAANDGRCATVFAQLTTKGENHGVHAFVVPLRDEATGNSLLPGVAICDCGVKVGLNGVDNGAIQFSGVRIPRENLLNRYGDVASDGTYSSPIASPVKRFAVTLGALTGGRVGLSVGSVAVMQLAVTIAIRYASMRRQFGGGGSSGQSGSNGGAEEEETLILDYPSHQQKLMPLLATAFAHQIAADFLVDRYEYMKQNPGDEAALAEVHTLSSGLKPVLTWATASALDVCREACGGHGYSAVNRLGELRDDHDIWKTFEGDNTVLLQQVAGELVKQYAKGIAKQGVARFYLNKVLDQARGGKTAGKGESDANPAVASRQNLRSSDFHLAAFRQREARLLETVALRLRKHSARLGQFEAWSRCMNHLLKLAKAHTETVVLERFVMRVAAVAASGDHVTAGHLKRLCDLYALTRIVQNIGAYRNAHVVSRARAAEISHEMERLCQEVRVHALPLLETFDIPDHIIRAPIGLAEPNMQAYLRNVGFEPKLTSAAGSMTVGDDANGGVGEDAQRVISNGESGLPAMK